MSAKQIFKNANKKGGKMKYVTGIHALNIPCALDTSGDWHASALRWENISVLDSESSLFGDYGIEHDKKIPKHAETYPVANHIRALLDLLAQGNFAVAQGMNNDFICNPGYDDEIFSQVMKMDKLPIWGEIDCFMGREYKLKWLNYKEASWKSGSQNTKK